MLARPGVEAGRHVPEPHHKETLNDPVEMERRAREGREWVMRGQTADAKK